jgi:CDGSH-type Zn-finger protein/quercetin dioxygenase-like cupin family protein
MVRGGARRLFAMSGPAVGGRRPCLVRFEKRGDVALWCACGRSTRQPFCDGSHRGTAFHPLRVEARADGEEALLCACKRTNSPPYCDGSHNSLGAYSDSEDSGAIDWNGASDVSLTHDSAVFALDGGCFVRRPARISGARLAGWRIDPLITPAQGAERLAQYRLTPAEEVTQRINFGSSEVALFVADAECDIEIAGRWLAAPKYASAAIRAGESIAARTRRGRPACLMATVCPPAIPQPADVGCFDSRFPDRILAARDSERRAMGDRFYQMLSSPQSGGEEITQFLGGIPRSRSAPHRHLYEEAILILSGSGLIWTESKKAPVRAGDVIYLPRKQLHCLECLSPEGMLLAGAFYPAGSPAINY